MRTVLKRPLLSEKSMSRNDQGQYVFEVRTDANKIEIRKAVEEAFDVQVQDVNTINVKGKLRRRRTRRGLTQGYTKARKNAIVTLTPDSKRIELFEGA